MRKISKFGNVLHNLENHVRAKGNLYLVESTAHGEKIFQSLANSETELRKLRENLDSELTGRLQQRYMSKTSDFPAQESFDIGLHTFLENKDEKNTVSSSSFSNQDTFSSQTVQLKMLLRNWDAIAQPNTSEGVIDMIDTEESKKADSGDIRTRILSEDAFSTAKNYDWYIYPLRKVEKVWRRLLKQMERAARPHVRLGYRRIEWTCVSLKVSSSPP